MPAPTPPTEAERAARAAFVEAKNDVALLIEVSNRGLAHDEDGFAQMLLDLSEQTPKLAVAARRLRHNLPARADSALPKPEPHPMLRAHWVYFIVWPDGEVFGNCRYLDERPVSYRAAPDFKRAVKKHPELRLYDAREGVFINPEEEK